MQQTPQHAVDWRSAPQSESGGAAHQSALGDGILLLNAFQLGEDWVPLPEISRRAALPQQVVRRLVGELEESGLLESGPQGIRLGEQLFVLGLRAPGPRHLRTVSRPVLDGIQSATGASAYLSVLDGGEVVHLDTVRGSSPAPNTTTVNESRAVCTAAVTKVLVSGTHSPAAPAEDAPFGEHGFDVPEATGHPHPGGQADGPAGSGTAGQEGGAATSGVVVLRSRQMLGVSAPVVHPRGHALAALTAVGPAHGMQQPLAIRHVQAGAATIARQAVQAENDRGYR
ncbi:hypothetical protein HCC61_29030 [Streptomyces sp. HNM0575]|uniref:hypothetical protein n=1 Tax=Streptomyces sp. HNM0575 TaxID=2716338 RepID=UPI00145D2C9F|nr:hypothetical protein [Streptomyces sp. HNM0575]NLU76621.1 hypothetical protein [Streptomyces sp. HNM0575]